jgi:hypothetical protein
LNDAKVKQMEDWKKHEKHDTDKKGLHKTLGFLDSQGRLRRFDGPQFWPLWTALGHDKGNFMECKCRRT